MAVFESKYFRTGRLQSVLPTLLLSWILLGCQQTSPTTTTKTASTPVPEPLAPIAKLQLEWANTPEKRQIGLMNRAVLPENAGMVFVFEQTKAHCFWMKNTLIPLDIGFIDAQGRLVQIQTMQAQSTDVHCPNQAISYALEVNQGWFAKHQITTGMQILKTQ